MPRFRIVEDDCIERMRRMPESRIDSIVCDPPYFLGFMGKAFDCEDRADADPQAAYSRHLQWCREALRVLKPGGHLLAFGGARTFHRLTCAVEDAGFEIRDSIAWVYAQGWSKGLNVAKAIDARLGTKGNVVGHGKGRTGVTAQPHGGSVHSDDNYRWPGEFEIFEPKSEEAKTWAGWRTTLRPAWEPIIMGRKPLDGDVVDNVLRHGSGALNIDGCRTLIEEELPSYTPSKSGLGKHGVYGSSGREQGADSPTRYDPGGRYPTDFVLTHSPGCREIGTRKVKTEGCRVTSLGQGRDGAETKGIYGSKIGKVVTAYADAEGCEAVSEWECVDGCPVHELGMQSGITRYGGGPVGGKGSPRRDTATDFPSGEQPTTRFDDRGTAARFFPCFKYQPKAPVAERAFLCRTCDGIFSGKERKAHKGHDVVSHPTQKPEALMRWLVRLVTPPGRIVLDPFCGSGSTGAAALAEGFQFIGIEKDPEYVRIARHRLEAE